MSETEDLIEGFVDNLVEDEAEKERLLAKPTCFIIVGMPGVGKSTLAKKIADSWKCILIDDTDLLNIHIQNKTKEGLELLDILSQGRSIPEDVVLQLILAKLNSPDVEHYGYVLSCLPFITEDSQKIHEQITMIKNLKLTPDFIINIKCMDKDLVQRLSGLKQHPVTGHFYSKDQWKHDKLDGKKEKSNDQEEDDEEEQTQQELPRIDQMVWTPENLPNNALISINMYKEMLLQPLEEYRRGHNPLHILDLDGNYTPEELHLVVMSHLGAMAVNPVSVPVHLQHPDIEYFSESGYMENLLQMMSSIGTVAPGFWWRSSRWGQICPVALKEGNITLGKPNFSVGFQDKLYILSSQEALQKFVTNPRQYLLPPMPRHPCRVSIIGPPHVGKSTLCKLLAQHYGAVILDVEDLLKAEQERLEIIKNETMQFAMEKIKMEMEQDGGQNLDEKSEVTEDHPEVQALVLSAVEEAKQSSTSPFDLYAEVLKKHITEIEEVDSDAGTRTGWVLDNFPKNISQVEALLQAGIMPDMILCLRDSDGHQVLKRAYEMNKEEMTAINDRLQDKEKKQVLKQTMHKSKPLSNLEKVIEDTDAEDTEQFDVTSPAEPDIKKQAVTLQDDDREFGYPDSPEMNDYKLNVKQFEAEWDQMQSVLSTTCCVLEIDSKTPENLLQEILQQMQKPFQYVPRQFSAFDMDEQTEYIKAITDLEKAEKENSASFTPEEEDEQRDTTAMRMLGGTKHFCPVALKNHNILQPCSDEIAAKYREKIYYFSSQDAIDSFLQNPKQFVAHDTPLKPPALRILLLGNRGSGKTTYGVWLAQQLGLFHIQFREQLQMLIMAKTKKKVPYADEYMSLEDDCADLEAQIQETRKEHKIETEDNSDKMNDVEEVDLTENEMAIQAYLSGEILLSQEILDIVVPQYWKQEPYISTGFILEGFPRDPEEVEYMVEKQLFPDAIVVMNADVADVQKHLLPTYLEKWGGLCKKKEAQLKLLQDLHKKNREEKMSKRRAELMAEHGPKETQNNFEDVDEEDESPNGIEVEIEALLEEEFPVEEENVDIKNETEDETIKRLEMEINERFKTDDRSLLNVTELLSEHMIPIIVVNAHNPLSIQKQLLRKIQPLQTNRESLFQTCHPITYSMAHTLLLSSYKFHSAFGCKDPVQQYKERDIIQPLQWPLNTTYPLLFNQYIYFFASMENRNKFMLNPLKYLRQQKPVPTLPIKIAVTGPPKSGKTTVAQMFAQDYGLARLSIGGVIRTVLNSQDHTDLAIQMKRYLSQGFVVPDELAVQCLEVVLMSGVCSTRGYVLDGFPMTLKQAKLMDSRSIIPMIVVELELGTVEVVKRGLVDKMDPHKPHVMHDSTEILQIANSCYKKEVEYVRNYFQQQYQNWFIFDGLKSKWWLWKHILKEVSISMKCIHTYLESRQSGKAASINRLCIPPRELKHGLGEFGHHCPVCLALYHHLVDCSESTALTHAAEYKGHYYKLCGEKHLQAFLSTPDQFVIPGCPHTLPQHYMLPRKLTEFQVRQRFPQQAEMKGFCPVTYLEGNQRYEALIKGKMEYAVEYREQIYIFETRQKQDKFLRAPEIYCDQKLPSKIPPLCEPLPLTALPILGYLEQGVAEPVIKALTAAGRLRPKYPFLSVQRSALLYVGLYLKAFNNKSTDYIRQMYKKKLAVFEENCALIPYLSVEMSRSYKPLSERPIDFEFKMKKFLALQVLGAKDVL